MSRKFVDIHAIASRNQARDGNIDHHFWFDKSIDEKLNAAIAMIEVAYNTSDFMHQKVDRNIVSASKR
jgi:hypothetical protein